jgi:hypothetical protein
VSGEAVGIGFDLDADPAVESIQKIGEVSEKAAQSADKLAEAGTRVANSADLAAQRTAAQTQETLRLNAQLNAADTTKAAAATRGLGNEYTTLIARMDALVAAAQKVDARNANASAAIVSQAAGVRALAQGTQDAAAVQERFDKVIQGLNQRVRDHAAATTTATSSNRYLTREMALSQIQALKMNEAFDHPEVHERHAEGLGRITTALGSLVGHAVGVPPVVDRIGEALGDLAVGGTITLGVTAGLALIVSLYEAFTEKAREAKKAADEFKQSDAGLDARRRAQLTEQSVTGEKSLQSRIPFFGEKDEIVGQTKEINELRTAWRGLANELNTSDIKNFELKNPDALKIFNTNLVELRRELASGSITLETYQHDLTDLDHAMPGFEREIVEARALGNQYDEVVKAVRRLQAAEENHRAEGRALVRDFGQPGTSFEQGGDDAVRLAESRRRLNDTQNEAAAAQAGGTLAVQRLRNEREANEAATEQWKSYVVATGNAELKTLSFNDALGRHNAVAQQFLRDSAAEIEAREKTTRTIQLQADVTKGTGEIEKQRALNNAFGQSDTTLRELAISYDALNQKRQNALARTQEERAQLDALTDSMAAEQRRAVELAAEKARNDARHTAGTASDAAATSAEQEASLVGKTADEVARQRIEFARLNEITAAHVALVKGLETADANDAAALFDVYDATVRAANARRDLARAAREVQQSTATDAMRQNREAIDAENAALASGAAQRKGYEIDLKAQLALKQAIATIQNPQLLQDRKDEIEATRQAEQQHRVLAEHIQELEERAKAIGRTVGNAVTSALDALTMKGKDFFQSWWDAGKRGLNKFIGDAVGQLASEKFGAAFGVGPGAAATKQTTAAATMLTAAQLQVQAAMIMQSTGWSTAVNGGIADASTVFNPTLAPTGRAPSALGTALGYGAIAGGGLLTGYGIGSSLYSTSHGDFGNYARGALGGAGAGALAGAAIGSVIPGIGTAAGAVIGGVTGLIGGILGIGSASKEAKRHLAELQKDLATSMDSLRAQVSHNDLGSQLAQVEADREQRRRAIEEAYQGGGANSENVRSRTALLREMNALEDQYIAQLKEEAAAKRATSARTRKSSRSALAPRSQRRRGARRRRSAAEGRRSPRLQRGAGAPSRRFPPHARHERCGESGGLRDSCRTRSRSTSRPTRSSRTRRR